MRPESYFELEAGKQRRMLEALIAETGQRGENLEKDIWVCQTLDILFNLPCKKPMAFKGGTSLSKVYKAIQRFSEDVDVTVNYKSLGVDVPDLATLDTNRKRQGIRDALQGALNRHVEEELVPEFKEALTSKFPNLQWRMDVEGEKVYLHYPTVYASDNPYVRPQVFIEFGGRNDTLPQENVQIHCDVAAYVPNVVFPIANVPVLSPQRTFWEKVTLIHVECQRPSFRAITSRLFRHWYDVDLLSAHDAGKTALLDKGLLEDVIKIKRAFFFAAYSNYDLCLDGRLKLIPGDELLKELRADHQKMIEAQMFQGDAAPADFDKIIERVRTLENSINKNHNAEPA
jgi:hypothetical protein